MSSSPVPETSTPLAAPWRRLLASVYDSLILLALLFVATAIASPFIDQHSSLQSTVVSVYLFGVIAGFYIGFWTHGGQTIGMRAWRLRLQQDDGGAVTYPLAIRRLISAIPVWGVFLLALLMTIMGEKIQWPAFFAPLLPYHGWLLAGSMVWLVLDNRSHCWRDGFSHTQVVWHPKT